MTGGLAALCAAVTVAAAVLVLPSRSTARAVVPQVTRRGQGAPTARAASGRPIGRPHGRSARGGRSRRGRPDGGDGQLVTLLDLLVPALRAGLPVALALGQPWEGDPAEEPTGEGRAGRRGRLGRWGRLGRRGDPGPPDWVTVMTVDLRRAAAEGRPLARVWADHAAAAGSAEGALVAGAWGLSESLGAPLADAVAEAASAVRQRVARARRFETVVAGPVATARVLTLLPVAGPLVAAALGIAPQQLYCGVGGICAVVGLVLLLVGRLWCARLIRGVVRPMTAAELR